MGLLRLFASEPQSRAEITNLVPNELIEWIAQSPINGKPDMQVKWQLTFTPNGDATQVNQQFRMFPYIFMTRMMITNSLKKQIAAGCKENLLVLKSLIENW